MNRLIAILSPLVLLLVLPFAPGHTDEATLVAGREHTQSFQNGDLDGIWDAMTEEMREALGSKDALKQLRAAVESQFGPERTVLSETIDTLDGFRVYLRTAQHDEGVPPLVLQWAFDSQDAIAGFFVRPAQQPADSNFLDYETKARLRLPFDGEWYVFWGGRTPEQNYHVTDPGQRFAYDFLVMRDGSSHAGDGTSLEDYHCWDMPVLAPASGTVVSAVDGLPDQTPGEMDPQNPAGNHVVIDLDNDEYAFLAHLREGSVRVAEGDRMESGQEIGRCGNSGNTSEPHLHLHIQTSPILGEGEGLPAFFNGYVADGEDVDRGEPVRGQTIEPQAD